MSTSAYVVDTVGTPKEIATRTTALARASVLLAVVALGLAACSRGSSAASPPSVGGPSLSASVGSSPPPPAGATTGSNGSSSATPPATPAGGSGDGGGNGSGSPTKDDLKVFAYATTDEKTTLADLDDVAAVVSTAQTDARNHDLNALQDDASALAGKVDGLAKDANAAKARQEPLEPEDTTLVKARKQAIDAFGAAASYATLASSLAELAANPTLQTLQTVIVLAGQLQGEQTQVTAAFDHLNTSLVAWSSAHPAAAAHALAVYGG